MKKDESFGVIPLKREGSGYQLLLVHHRAGHWAFPKGHADHENETPHQAAERELGEETGLLVDEWLDHPPLHEHYTFTYEGETIDKKVTYFVALVHGIISLQEEEVSNALWLSPQDAANLITFPEGREMLQKVVFPQ